MNLLATIAALAACFPSAPQDPPATPAEKIELHRAADAHLVRRRPVPAITAFEVALVADPENATLHYGLACALASCGQKDRAFAALGKATELGFRDAGLAYWDGNLRLLSYDPRFEALLGPQPPAPAEPAEWSFIGARGPQVLAPAAVDWIVYALPGGGLEVLDAATGETRFATLGAPAPIVAMGTDVGSARIACLHADGLLTLVDAGTGEATRGGVANGPMGSRWSPVHLAFVGKDQRIVLRGAGRAAVWDGGGKFVHRITGSGEKASFPAGPSTASLLIPEAIGTKVRLHDALDPGVEPRTLEFEHRVRAAQISPDGKTLAVGTDFAEVHLIELEGFAEVMAHVITDEMTKTAHDPFGEPLWVPSLAFSPGSQRLGACTASGYHVAVFDVGERALLWRTGHKGGRMGSPLPLLCGEELTVADRGRLLWRSGGEEVPRKPFLGPCQVAAVLGSTVLRVRTAGALERHDVGSGTTVWSSPASARARRRLVHPSGWFAGEPGEVTEEDVRRFDPKRLRAALGGVKLLPPF